MPKDSCIPQIEVLFPPTPDESYLLVSCSRSDYSASLIARAVEDCDARVLNLNVTTLPSAEGDDVVVALRIDHRHTTAVVRSLERYGYEVCAAVAADDDETSNMRSRADELLRYLEI